MFERFSRRARRVIEGAQDRARGLDHDHVGTEHVLLAIVGVETVAAARALDALGISLDAVRGRVEEIVGRGDGSPSGHVPFTLGAKKTLELALREALQVGDDFIGTEHLLLGLIREGEGVAAQVLSEVGADLDRVRLQVVRSRPGDGGPPRAITSRAVLLAETCDPLAEPVPADTTPRGLEDHRYTSSTIP